MKVGILAYNSVINFGALLQLLSTYMFFKEHGDDPVVINWLPKDLESYYSAFKLQSQEEECQRFRKKYWRETTLCRTSKDIAEIIKSEGIEAVVIGSDAVAQNHPFLERILFPTKRIVSLRNITSDRRFPNPFWGEFAIFLNKQIPICYMSASSQDSSYRLIFNKERKLMKHALTRFSFISVRDDWTRDMISYISDGEIIPDVTPDPVFAFNQNASKLLPTPDEIRSRFSLKDKYILFSFKTNTVSQEWLNRLESLAKAEDIEFVKLPFSDSIGFGESKHVINLPLSPIDWYALIKYSAGYIGNNMHPIVVSIHNQIPFFSFDNYGRKKMNGLVVDDSSSKILHIISMAGLNDNRISSIKRGFSAPNPEYVIERIKSFDTDKAYNFASDYYGRYTAMMNKIISKIQEK